MDQTSYIWNPPAVRSLPIRGMTERLPINRILITLTVNGEPRQKSDIDKRIWDIREQVADLSQFYHLQPGDLIFTGTPEGVGPVAPGDRIEGHVAGVGDITLQIGPAE